MRGSRRRRYTIVAGAVTLLLVAGCGSTAEEPTGTSAVGPTTEISSLPSTTVDTKHPTTTTVTTETVPSPTTSTVPATTIPQPTLPTGPIPEDEAGACAGIQDRLRTYQDLAESTKFDGLLTLQLGLEEFENEIDFISQQQDWGLLMLEQLVQVRREWSTAYSAYMSDQVADAESHFESAMSYMDEALAVACP